MAFDAAYGLMGSKNFHDWLIQSAYVRPVDDERKRKGKKKGNKKQEEGRSRDKSTHPAPDLHVGSSWATAPADLAALAGKRKSRRWANDRLLREMAGPLDASDIAALYAPPPWGEKSERPLFEQLTDTRLLSSAGKGGAGAGAGGSQPGGWPHWEALVGHGDMDKERALIQPARTATRRNRSTTGAPPATLAEESANSSSAASGGTPIAAADAVRRWRGVDKNARSALKSFARAPLVQAMEDLLLLSFMPTASPLPGSCFSREGLVEHLESVGVDVVISPPPAAAGVGTGTAEAAAAAVCADAGVSAHVGVDVAPAEEEPPSTAHTGALSSDQEHSSDQDTCCLPRVSWCEEEVVEEAGRMLVLSVHSSFLRLLLHGICQFHGLVACTVNVSCLHQAVTALSAAAAEGGIEPEQQQQNLHEAREQQGQSLMVICRDPDFFAHQLSLLCDSGAVQRQGQRHQVPRGRAGSSEGSLLRQTPGGEGRGEGGIHHSPSDFRSSDDYSRDSQATMQPWLIRSEVRLSDVFGAYHQRENSPFE